MEQWQATYVSIEAQLDSLTREQEEPKAKQSSLGTTTVDRKPDSSALQSVEESKDKDSKISELASQVEDLTQQLQDSGSAAANAIEQWQAAYTDIETQWKTLTAENEQLKSKQASLGPEVVGNSE